ncbi:hypothetical protein [Clostridium folliculivorans]|uniref:Uncharacterized protein n=1 Tax=Clostridium folliculivorans TaxID=2886038 RepID=A0A9W5Y6S6_9CLOT|nr:hypothetical protein [Clostridium folliculivorans]GKU27625.1 hypothetical protein CFOLD11_44520 [Clostridium folliculivorans]GKU32388.1 hypothetical protein CFB3_44960 [Clostridium folliculivorans]
MKKRFIIIAIYLLVAIVLQTSVLALINYKYLAGFSVPDKVVSSKQIEAPKPVEKKNLIEAGAIDIKASESNKYVSYIKDNQLKYLILDKYDLSVASDVKPYLYIWLYDDKILYINNIKSDTNNYEFYIYDIDKKEKNLVATLKLQDENAQLEKVVSSSLKNLLFVKVKSYGKEKIMKLNTHQGVFEDVNTQSRDVEDLSVIPHEDKIIYNTKSLNKFYISYIGRTIALKENGQQVLLGVDNSDRVFIGISKNDAITSIYYGLINEGIDSWTKVQVKNSIKKDDILISKDGKIFELNAETQIIKSIVGDKELTYKGTYLNMKDNNILSIKDNEVIVNKSESIVKN